VTGGGRFWLAAPLILFAIIALVFKLALTSGDPSKLPSALIGKPAPAFDLPPVDGLLRDGALVPGLAAGDLAKGKIIVLNVFASWCGPCHEEHPMLMQLAQAGRVELVGLNYKDDPADARRFLGKLGNPYARIGSDGKGRVALDFGVYGVPETFVIDGRGRITFKHVGPLSAETIKDSLLPAIEAAGRS
jgi:cytochrome c biogenesis protein CcmG/thiol:disulfide interchange protein DsbE